MNKKFAFFMSVTFLLLMSGVIYASVCPGYENALVPCGQNSVNPPGDWGPTCPCELSDFFVMVKRIYDFIILIGSAVAGLLVVIGGVLIIISGGPGGKNPVTGIVSPNLYSTAKNMVLWAVIAILLILSAWVIINVVLMAIGYTGAWGSFPTV